MSRAQALVELAVCAPIVVLLGLGAAGAIQVAEAQAGLDAATRTAVAVAARAPDATLAQSAARSRFEAVLAAYPLREGKLSIDYGTFGRGGSIVVTGVAQVDIGWAALVFPQRRLELRAKSSAQIDPWRSRP